MFNSQIIPVSCNYTWYMWCFGHLTFPLFQYLAYDQAMNQLHSEEISFQLILCDFNRVVNVKLSLSYNCNAKIVIILIKLLMSCLALLKNIWEVFFSPCVQGTDLVHNRSEEPSFI